MGAHSENVTENGEQGFPTSPYMGAIHEKKRNSGLTSHENEAAEEGSSK